MRLARGVIAATALVALAACSSGRPRGPAPEIINRALAGAPGEAQPSRIVSREIAFARAAREEGQWSAFKQFAAPSAVIHGAGGTVNAAEWLAGQRDPDEPVQWGVRKVVMSCDGALAISQGRFQTPEGIVGNYVTVWARQPDNSYLYTYDAAGPDVPQPPPRREFEDGDIVVTALDIVEGLIADCPRAGESYPAPPAIPIGEDGAAGAQLSSDGTLRWRWEHREAGVKYIQADYLHNGAWVSVVEESLASAP